MSSFHDQWMDAHQEAGRVENLSARETLLGLLGEARLLIDEENPRSDRLGGGYIVRAVRRECRRWQDSGAVAA